MYLLVDYHGVCMCFRSRLLYSSVYVWQSRSITAVQSKSLVHLHPFFQVLLNSVSGTMCIGGRWEITYINLAKCGEKQRTIVCDWGITYRPLWPQIWINQLAVCRSPTIPDGYTAQNSYIILSVSPVFIKLFDPCCSNTFPLCGHISISGAYKASYVDDEHNNIVEYQSPFSVNTKNG